MKGNNIKNTVTHLQKAKDTGGTNSTPPLATIKLLAIKIGWINNNKKGKYLLLELFTVNGKLVFIEKGFVNHHKNCNCHQNIYW